MNYSLYMYMYLQKLFWIFDRAAACQTLHNRLLVGPHALHALEKYMRL
jgi:hypothetical protein